MTVSPTSPLVEVDRRIARKQSGMVLVDGPEPERMALLEHCVRRAALAQRRCLAVDGRHEVEPWRAVARRLGLRANRPAAHMARQLDAALDESTVLVMVADGTTHWGSAVVDALSERRLRATYVVLGEYRAHVPRLQLEGEREPQDASCFLEALMEFVRAQALATPSLADLADWWAAPKPRVLPVAPPQLCPVPTSTEEATDGWQALDIAEDAVQNDPELAAMWARRAVQLAPDAASRADFWDRFDRGIRPVASDTTVLDFAELALQCGDVDCTLRLVSHCSDVAPRTARLLEGRAASMRGLFDRAQSALTRASALTTADEERAEVDVAWAELSLAAGNREEARRFGERALEHAEGPVRLAARNVVGKVLLAEGRWCEAEAHFVVDENQASVPVERLRARVNRAIATMSQQRRLEARDLLGSVLRDATRLDHRRAIAFALCNLGVLYARSEEYVESLEILDRALDAVRVLGDSRRLVSVICSLAFVRMRLGLLDEATHVLAFGRRAASGALPGSIQAALNCTEAEVYLAQGDTQRAWGAITEALANTSRADDGGRENTAHRVAARIALAEGDILRARHHLAAAEDVPLNHNGRQDAMVLKARLARAAGEPYRALAVSATEAAAGEDELAREAHTLAGMAALDEGDTDVAGHHLDAARAARNRIGATLPEALRHSFLARSDMADLAELEARLTALAAAPDQPLPSSPVPRPHPELVGKSELMNQLRHAIGKVGPSEASVLIVGESGTGKELVADALHRESRRSEGPLVKVNCAALVESLLLTELFGHERGAFTGANTQKVGLFEHAQGGTIFLDEIGDISPATQVALLRVLQERTIERVGGCEPIHVDVRVLCATHRNLPEMVAAGTFREDLYYRVCGFSLEVPALRNHPEDIADLAETLLRRHALQANARPKRLSQEAAATLMKHDWPGNVRELENALRVAAVFSEGELITTQDLSDHIDALRVSSPAKAPLPTTEGSPDELVYAALRTRGLSLPDMKRALERACIERALTESDGNITHAAKLLGMKRPRVSQLVNQFAKKGRTS